MLNIYEQVDANKAKSASIVFLFIVFVVSFVWLLARFWGVNQSWVTMAIVFSLFSSATSYFWGDKIVLAISGARPATREEYFNFYTAAENLAIAAQIPTPKLYLIDSPAMNAFATGRDPKNATICATTGLLERLNRSEIEAVIGHELSHITNYDTLLMTITAVLVGMISLLSDWSLRISRFGYRKKDNDRDSLNPVMILIGLIAAIISPIAAKLIQLALSRRREYLADASAVKLTRQPQGLIDALEKLAASEVPLTTASTATAHLYIVNPFTGKLRKLAGLFSTHPPIEERIGKLREMA